MSSLQRQISALAGLALDVILPPRCALSGEFVDRQGMMAPAAWASLEFIGEPLCDTCGIPFEFSVEEKTKCLGCLSDPPPYSAARAALKYGDASRSLILGFKHADKIHMAGSFTPWLMRAGGEVLKNADFLVPVPLHYRRLLARRYNQADLIARSLARETGIPCLSEALRRTRSTPSQGHLKADERAKNVRRAFALNARFAERIKGARVVLIDDVYTTGSTVKECTKVLLKAGVSDVSVLTLARVVKGE